YQVVLVAMEDMQRAQRLAHQLLPATRTAPYTAQGLAQHFEPAQAGVVDLHPGIANGELAACKLARQVERLPVHRLLLPLARLAGKDERRARLVNQDAVSFVHDGEREAAQDEALACIRAR